MPGKRTLVAQAQMPAVQMHGGGNEQPEGAVHAAAARGVASPGSALPFGSTIQRAFGRHDVSAVQAHTGPEAKRSAKSMGADAYAAGDHVVLGEKSDLHTVAHEAAHVVQQRGGVQLKGGVGQVGDSYEQHADAVADKVVAGESAEGLLSTMAGPGGGGQPAAQAGGPVQQTKGEEPADGEHEGTEHEDHEGHEAGEHDHDDALDEHAEAAAKETAPKETKADAKAEGANAKTAQAPNAAANGNAAQAPGAPVQMKASSAGRALGAVLMKRKSTSRRHRGYRPAPSLSAARSGGAVIRRGMEGSSVRFVQEHVHADVDGMFGPQTQAAVKHFQRSHHLEVDGIVGMHTMAAMDHGGGGVAHGGGGSGHHDDDGGGPPTGSEAAIREQVIDKANNHMGARYSWAAEGPSMFDCSGFAWYVLHTDMHLTKGGRTTAAGLSHAPYTTPTSSPQKGDLVFYSSGGISHVTIALGHGSQVIGASGGGSHTHGQDPNARVKITDWSRDSRHKSFGSIRGLIKNKK
jgi:peptidoglycan hydrolase-like protein with peptidoglycan-binding domain